VKRELKYRDEDKREGRMRCCSPTAKEEREKWREQRKKGSTVKQQIIGRLERSLSERTL
jgi:hypothetical protein